LSVSMGILRFLHAPGTLVGDLIPVDHVVSSLLAAVPHTLANPDTPSIMHCGSSDECPMSWDLFKIASLDYYRDNLAARAVAQPDFHFFRTGQMYQLNLFFRNSVPSAIINTLALMGNEKLKDKANMLNKIVWRVRVIAQSFHHFINYEWRFHTKNLTACYNNLPAEERAEFDIDIAAIDMGRYVQIFNYGLMKYVLKEPVIEKQVARTRDVPYTDLVTDFHRNIPKMPFYRRVAPDADWMLDNMMKRPSFPQSRSASSMREIVIAAPEVRLAIQNLAASGKKSVPQLEKEADKICQKMFGNVQMPLVGGLSLVFKKIWRRIYRAMMIDSAGVKRCQEAAANGPLIYIPTHRSYIDFLIVSYMCFAMKLPIPFIAAGEDFLGILFVRWMFRNCGAFFIRRSFANDPLYVAIFNAYTEQLLVDGQSIEFFIEGTRSRSGKMLSPKLGMLSAVTRSFLQKKVPNLSIVPIAINYERIMEANSYSTELLGEKKIRESLRSLLNSLSVLSLNFGRVTVKFGEVICLSSFVEKAVEHKRDPAHHPPPFDPTPPHLPSSLVAKYQASMKISTVAKADYNPFQNEDDARDLNSTLGYRVIHELSLNTQCMPTHLVATLMLMYRQGITKEELLSQCIWLNKEIVSRGGTVAGFEMMHSGQVIDRALKQLRPLLTQRSAAVVEPNISARSVYHNMLALGHYRNRIIHIFFRESLWACALYALGGDSHKGVRQDRLLEEVIFLFEGLRREFLDTPSPDAEEPFELYLDSMIESGILKRSNVSFFVYVSCSSLFFFSFPFSLSIFIYCMPELVFHKTKLSKLLRGSKPGYI